MKIHIENFERRIESMKEEEHAKEREIRSLKEELRRKDAELAKAKESLSKHLMTNSNLIQPSRMQPLNPPNKSDDYSSPLSLLKKGYDNLEHLDDDDE